jgi:hypothetical protein
MKFLTTNYCSEDATVISASNINASFPASNLKHTFRSKRVRTADGTTTLAVVLDLATTEAVDSVVFLWPKEDGIKLSNTAVVKIQANATNVWTSPAVDQTLSIDNTYMVASYFFNSDRNYRYWRIYISDPGNAYGYVELGKCWLGKSLSVPNAQNGFKFRLVDTTKVTRTDFGHQYADEYPLVASVQVAYNFLDYATIQISIRHSARTAFESRCYSR